jgi:hypothetical protein
LGKGRYNKVTLRRNRVVAKLIGGLGNQLFVYFAALSFAREHNRDLICDLSFIEQSHSGGQSRLDYFVLEAQVIESKATMRKAKELREKVTDSLSIRGIPILNRSYLDEVSMIDKSVTPPSKTLYLRGFHNTTKHFESIGRPKMQLKVESAEFNSLKKEISQSVALHLRGGDYALFQDTFGPLSSQYYLNALTAHPAVDKIAKSRDVYLFSDDRLRSSKLKEVLMTHGYAVNEVSHNYGFAPAEELLLISSAKAIVMGNSTFSFWASEFSNSETIIISPSDYTRFGGAIDFESQRTRLVNQSDWEK